MRASAQNLFNLVIVGIGIIVGSWFATSVVGSFATEVVGTAPDGTDETAMNYTKLFGVPLWIAVGCLVALLVLYPARAEPKEPGGGSDPEQA